MPTEPEAVLAVPSPSAIREELTEMVVKDLLGPAGGPEEELPKEEDHVYGRYLVGLLAPVAESDGEEQDALGTAGKDDPELGPSDISTPPANTFLPNSMGMSFVVDSAAKAIRIETEWGRYEKVKSETQKQKDGSAASVWRRLPRIGEPLRIVLEDGPIGPLTPRADSDATVAVQGKVRRTPRGWFVTLFLVNNTPEKNKRKDEAWVFQAKMRVRDAREPAQAIFVQRRDWRQDLSLMDEESREELEALEMLYRDRLEFAIGHGISVRATSAAVGAERAMAVETEYVPCAEVEQRTSPKEGENADLVGVVLDMKQLAELPTADLLANLSKLQAAYGAWIEREAAKIGNPAERLGDHQAAARRAVERCGRTNARLAEGIALIENNPTAEAAFRFANRAMWQQRVRSTYARLVRKKELAQGADVTPVDREERRTWRLFQLAFILLNLPSVTRLDHPDRSHETDAIADLLWFPTGGGKTEAYLGLTAYTLALRRLQGVIEGRTGDHGVAVLMRYTLRLLTLQQFQRAAALICACEAIRKGDTAQWGTVPFRLGLWVGAKATPNSLKAAAEALRQGNMGGRPSAGGTPHQLVSCPWCGCEIQPRHLKVLEPPSEIGRCVTYCGDATGRCEFSEAQSPKEGLPVMVVDEDIYRRPPSLIIATVDKFAQMAWKGQTQNLFGQIDGLCLRHGFLSPEIEKDDSGNHPARASLPRVQRQEHGPLRPPDLIIQDELHLISGPLGSMVALYETAIDELCTWVVNGKRVRPKVIASAATIRRAPDQVRKLFLRQLEVFPPQGTSIKDNFFAVQRVAGAEYPGRRYLGICAFGRRYPAAMIRVYVAVMAAAQRLFEKYDKLADSWMTLAGYFNSIRELAGTRRLLDDDIRTRLRYAPQRGLSARRIHSWTIEELTSRKSGGEIPRILERLDTVFDKAQLAQREADRKAGRKPAEYPYDAILATNMISVGVDIERLGVMVVAGQPKTTAEYIQATSRVGRGNTPGLVVTLFNWARPRDLSHYEGFEHYHETFYKHVEPLSVTPFSARALDRGLTGVLVSLMRLRDDRLNENTTAGTLSDSDPAMPAVIELIAKRAETALQDTGAGEMVREKLGARRDFWLARVRQQLDFKLGYQEDSPAVVGLLKQPGKTDWDLFTCLNSLRDVEGTVDLVLHPNPAGLRASE